MRIVRNDVEFQAEGGITPGKLADPSNMGGLSLLLMAGQQTQTQTISVGNRQEHSYVQEPPPPPPPQAVKPEPLTPGTAAQQRNAALLELAEMCSNELGHSDVQNSKISHETVRSSQVHTQGRAPDQYIPLSLLPNSHQTPFGASIPHLNIDSSQAGMANQHPSQVGLTNQNMSQPRQANQPPAGPANQHQSLSVPVNQQLPQSVLTNQHHLPPRKPHQYPLSSLKINQYPNQTQDRSPSCQADHKNSSTRLSLLEEALKDDPIDRKAITPTPVVNFTCSDRNGNIANSPHKPVVASNKNVVDCIIDKFFLATSQPQVYMDPNMPEQQVPLNLVKKEAKYSVQETKHIGTDVKFIEKKDGDAKHILDKESSTVMNSDTEAELDVKLNVQKDLMESKEMSNSPCNFYGEPQVFRENLVFEEKVVEEETTPQQEEQDLAMEEKPQMDTSPVKDTIEDTAGCPPTSQREECVGQSPSQELDYELDYEEEPSDDYQPVRKSKRRNRGQRYKELINEGIIQPSKERLAAMRSEQTGPRDESVTDEDEYKGLENIVDQYPPVIRRARKRTASESEKTKPQPPLDDAKRYKTGDFDLEAHIATLPACSLENVSRNGRRACSAKSRHQSESGKKVPPEDGEVTVENSFCLPPHVKLKQNEVAPQNLVGSKKRKARKYSINHMLPMPEESKQVVRNVRSVSLPSDIADDGDTAISQEKCEEHAPSPKGTDPNSQRNTQTSSQAGYEDMSHDENQLTRTYETESNKHLGDTEQKDFLVSAVALFDGNGSALPMSYCKGFNSGLDIPSNSSPSLNTVYDGNKNFKSESEVVSAAQVEHEVMGGFGNIATMETKTTLAVVDKLKFVESGLTPGESSSKFFAKSNISQSDYDNITFHSKSCEEKKVLLESLKEPVTKHCSDEAISRTFGSDIAEGVRECCESIVLKAENLLKSEGFSREHVSLHKSDKFNKNSSILEEDASLVNCAVKLKNCEAVISCDKDANISATVPNMKLKTQVETSETTHPEVSKTHSLSSHNCTNRSGVEIGVEVQNPGTSVGVENLDTHKQEENMKQQCLKTVTELLENNPELIISRNITLMENVQNAKCQRATRGYVSFTKSKNNVEEKSIANGDTEGRLTKTGSIHSDSIVTTVSRTEPNIEMSQSNTLVTCADGEDNQWEGLKVSVGNDIISTPASS
ncbi:hypothetical protein ScPMuIL_002530 [Solemya velum]